jgi:Holliday junction resolvase-like predicted endonuclease
VWLHGRERVLTRNFLFIGRVDVVMDQETWIHFVEINSKINPQFNDSVTIYLFPST